MSDSGSLSVRIDRVTRIEVDASGDVRIALRDDVDAALGRRLRKGDGRGAMAAARRIEGGAAVTPAMEAAAVEAFLARVDVTRLSRSLAEVYTAMEAVRRPGGGRDQGET